MQLFFPFNYACTCMYIRIRMYMYIHMYMYVCIILQLGQVAKCTCTYVCMSSKILLNQLVSLYMLCFYITQECAQFFLNTPREKIRAAMSSLMVEVLLPVAAVINIETSLPVAKKLVSMLYGHCADAAKKTRHSNVGSGSYTATYIYTLHPFSFVPCPMLSFLLISCFFPPQNQRREGELSPRPVQNGVFILYYFSQMWCENCDNIALIS